MTPVACSVALPQTFDIREKFTEETIPMKQTWHGYSAFPIQAGEARIVIDPFLSDNPSRDIEWRGYLTGRNSTHGSDR